MIPINTVNFKLWQIHTAGVALCIVLTTTIYFNSVYPILRAREDFSLQKSEIEEQRRIASDLSASLGTFKHEIASVQQALEKSPLQLQSADHINQRLAQFTELASEHGLDIQQIQPGQITHDVHYDIVPIHLSGEGSYRTHAAFIHTIHRNFPDTGVSSFKLSGKPGQPNAPASFDLNLMWYTLPTANRKQKN